MLQKLHSWLIRHRDQTAVSYNRFGRPGEEDEDKPPPSEILVAPFNENSPEFMLFNVCHVQKAAVYFACFGLSMVILSFITTFFEFDWYHHQKGIDVTALLGLFLYLAGGVFIHYCVIYGVKKQKARYLLPFIAVYSVMCCLSLFTCLALLFKSIDPEAKVVAASGITVHHPPFLWILLGMMIIGCVQTVMLMAVLHCRYFLSQKELHEMALRVAEKSRQEYPSIQIVVAGRAGGRTALNGTIGGEQQRNGTATTQPNSQNGGPTTTGTASGASTNSGEQPIILGIV